MSLLGYYDTDRENSEDPVLTGEHWRGVLLLGRGQTQ